MNIVYHDGAFGEEMMEARASMNCSPTILPPWPKPVPTTDVVVTINFKDKNGDPMTENLPSSVNLELVDIVGNQTATQANNYTTNFMGVPVSKNYTIETNVPDFTSNVVPTATGFEVELQSMSYEPATKYTVTVTNDSHGTATATPNTAIAGTEITLTANANEGYQFNQWEVVSGSVTISDNKFTMPDEDVEIKATFSEIAPVDVQWTNAVQAGGDSGSADTTSIDLTFSQEISTLTSGNFSIDGATVGQLTGGENGIYNLGINNITVADSTNITITVTNPVGFNIVPNSKEVEVYRHNITIDTISSPINVLSFDFAEEHPDVTPPQRLFTGGSYRQLVAGVTKDNFSSDSGEVVYYSDSTENGITYFDLGLNNVDKFQPDEVTITMTNPPGYVINPNSFTLNCKRGDLVKGAPDTTTLTFNTVFKDGSGTVIEAPDDFKMFYILNGSVSGADVYSAVITKDDNYTGECVILSTEVNNITFTLQDAITGWEFNITNDGNVYTVNFQKQ